MIKVCVVVENHPSAVMGGAQYQGHLLAEELAKQPGTQVTYIARRADEKRCREEGLIYAVKVIGRVGGVRDRASFFDLDALRRALEEIRPDVVYQQMRQSLTATCAAYARQARVPFFFHIASDMDLDPSWLPGKLLSRRLPFEVVEAMMGIRGMRRATHVIAQTQRQAHVLRERFGKQAATIVRNFQPLPDRVPEKPRDGKVRVLWVANFKEVKRPDLFVDLAQRFAGRSDIEFLMVGRPMPMASRRERLMQRIAETPNLRYLGEMSIEEVNREMARAHFHVNTSSIEGFPNTFIQAWANGAVVATIAVDPDEEGMERLGIGFCTGSLDRLEQLIDRLSRSEPERMAVAERAFAFAHEKHSMAHGATLARAMVEAGRKGQGGDDQ